METEVILMLESRYWDIVMNGRELTEAEVASGWHYCDDWDGMLIGPGMEEMDTCICEGVNHDCHASITMSNFDKLAKGPNGRQWIEGGPSEEDGPWAKGWEDRVSPKEDWKGVILGECEPRYLHED